MTINRAKVYTTSQTWPPWQFPLALLSKLYRTGHSLKSEQTEAFRPSSVVVGGGCVVVGGWVVVGLVVVPGVGSVVATVVKNSFMTSLMTFS